MKPHQNTKSNYELHRLNYGHPLPVLTLKREAAKFSNNLHNIETTKTTFLVGIRTWIFHMNSSPINLGQNKPKQTLNQIV